MGRREHLICKFLLTFVEHCSLRVYPIDFGLMVCEPSGNQDFLKTCEHSYTSG